MTVKKIYCCPLLIRKKNENSKNYPNHKNGIEKKLYHFKTTIIELENCIVNVIKNLIFKNSMTTWRRHSYSAGYFFLILFLEFS